MKSSPVEAWDTARAALADLRSVRAEKALAHRIDDALITREARAMDALAGAMLALDALGATDDFRDFLALAYREA